MHTFVVVDAHREHHEMVAASSSYSQIPPVSIPGPPACWRRHCCRPAVCLNSCFAGEIWAHRNLALGACRVLWFCRACGEHYLNRPRSGAMHNKDILVAFVKISAPSRSNSQASHGRRAATNISLNLNSLKKAVVSLRLHAKAGRTTVGETSQQLCRLLTSFRNTIPTPFHKHPSSRSVLSFTEPPPDPAVGSPIRNNPSS